MSFVAPQVDSADVVALIRDKSKIPEKDYVVIDVRDRDFHGGNVPGAVNVPANQLINRGNELIEKYKEVPLVIFHCALSQERGPKSARIYNEMRQLMGHAGEQKVVVMRGGFDGWHARYHKEKDLIANYEPSIWGVFEEEESVEDNPFLAGIPK